MDCIAQGALKTAGDPLDSLELGGPKNLSILIWENERLDGVKKCSQWVSADWDGKTKILS